VTDVNHYAVEVDGRAVLVQDAIYDGSSRTVTLGLEPGALKAGDQVVVLWSNLRDAQGRLLSDRVGPLRAQ
jgi:hypothetical protein